MKYYTFSLIFLFLLNFFFIGCGRKQKNIFSFPEKNTEPQVNKLSLPCVRGVCTKKLKNGMKISWNPIKNDNSLKISDINITKKFIGYDIYKLVNCCFVPKKSLNNFPIKKTEFVDHEILCEKNTIKTLCSCYLIKAVFRINGKIISGPVSKIVCEKNYPPT
ncbi:hypothetical protein ACFLYH_01765 [Candidatus Dependentiae bacterium]